MRVLGCDVSAELLSRWVEWFAPGNQPFLVDKTFPGAVPVDLSDELRDSYELYGNYGGSGLLWLDEEAFAAMPRPRRAALVRDQVERRRGLLPTVRRWPALGDAPRGQADGHRFVWWPSLLEVHAVEVLSAFINDGRRTSRHDQVAESTWSAASELLPEARRLAGCFPSGSGPNCFGTVMAATGEPGAAEVWMQREPFEAWLSGQCRPGGQDCSVGTVLVWRSADGAVQHAAVTLGDGWALHKPSQGWMSPTKVLAVRDAIASARARGLRLQRYQLQAALIPGRQMASPR